MCANCQSRLACQACYARLPAKGYDWCWQCEAEWFIANPVEFAAVDAIPGTDAIWPLIRNSVIGGLQLRADSSSETSGSGASEKTVPAMASKPMVLTGRESPIANVASGPLVTVPMVAVPKISVLRNYQKFEHDAASDAYMRACDSQRGAA
jgi:hypothetical protein